MVEFNDDMTVGETRELLRAAIWDREKHKPRKPSECPVCKRRAQVYRWSLYARAARLLIALYRKGGTTKFVESKTVKIAGDGGDIARLGYWGLVEHERERRPDGGKSGWWRVTEFGGRFVRREATIPKYVYVFANRVLHRDGVPVTIVDALGTDFNYDEMMGGGDGE